MSKHYESEWSILQWYVHCKPFLDITQLEGLNKYMFILMREALQQLTTNNKQNVYFDDFIFQHNSYAICTSMNFGHQKKTSNGFHNRYRHTTYNSSRHLEKIKWSIRIKLRRNQIWLCLRSSLEKDWRLCKLAQYSL